MIRVAGLVACKMFSRAVLPSSGGGQVWGVCALDIKLQVFCGSVAIPKTY